MKKTHSIIVWLFPILMTGTVSAGQLQECNAFASEINKNYPQRVDKITTVKGTVCTPDGRGIALEYYMIVDDEYASFLNQPLISAELQPKQKNSWCSDPRQRELLNLYSIRYRYFSQSQLFLGSAYINKKMC
jgi:hypothetical protein